jgi:hypothetical protein
VSVDQVPIHCSDVFDWSADKLPTFSALMDFDKDKEAVVEFHDEYCEAGQKYDERTVSVKSSGKCKVRNTTNVR